MCRRIIPLCSVSIVLIAILGLLLTSLPSNAQDPYSPRVYFPVDPCRAVDTRPLSTPLMAGTAMDVYVRGSNLPATQSGATDCNIPSTATGIVVNIAVIAPTTAGNLRANRTGVVANPSSPYSRINYAPGENIANEMMVELCNAASYPAEHVPCAGPVAGTYSDFQILNTSVAGSSVHLIVDVIGYTARMPLTSAVAGIVTDKQTASGNPPAILLVLDNGLRVICVLPWSTHTNCDAQLGWTVKAAGHVENFRGHPAIYAHGEVGVDEH